MAEYSKKAQGTVLATGGNMPIYLPFVPDFVQCWNMTSVANPQTEDFPYMMWNKFFPAGTAYNFTFANPSTDIAAGAYNNQSPNLSGITPIYNGLSLQYEAPISITSITKSTTPVITASSDINFNNGDVVIFEGLAQSSTTGMQQISGIPFTVINATSSGATFSINWNTNQSNYTALSGSPAGAQFRRLKNPYLYQPGVVNIASITAGTSTTITTTMNHNMFVGQEVAFRIPPQYGMTQLNNNNRKIPGQPLYAVVVSVVNNRSVIVNVDSSQFTAFNTNVPFANVSGLSFPQMVAVGNVNMGGSPLSPLQTSLYPSPSIAYGGQSTQADTSLATPNGPGIQGAFTNDTRCGFIIGNLIEGSIGDQIYWEASIHDYSSGVPLSLA